MQYMFIGCALCVPSINLKAGTTQNNKADIIAAFLEFN